MTGKACIGQGSGSAYTQSDSRVVTSVKVPCFRHKHTYIRDAAARVAISNCAPAVVAIACIIRSVNQRFEVWATLSFTGSFRREGYDLSLFPSDLRQLQSCALSVSMFGKCILLYVGRDKKWYCAKRMQNFCSLAFN